jgi:hypothetical protein
LQLHLKRPLVIGFAWDDDLELSCFIEGLVFWLLRSTLSNVGVFQRF